MFKELKVKYCLQQSYGEPILHKTFQQALGEHKHTMIKKNIRNVHKT